ncbi:MAG: UDP-glucose 6-dehydrogenase TuaD [Accumulibacter sp.]|nr:MAG: UDP-glucose 6-dehydrogenase TuaD [Accumulibacter sp.]
MVRRSVAAGRLHFTTDVERAVQHGTILFIAVGTPPDEDGSAGLQYVLAAARGIGRVMTDYKVVVDRSTVPVGTGDAVDAAVAAELPERGVDIPCSVVSNPNSEGPEARRREAPVVARAGPAPTRSGTATATASSPRARWILSSPRDGLMIRVHPLNG